MFHLVDFNNPMIRAIIVVQVIGFPLAFLIRAALHGLRSRREIPPAKRISLLKVAYNVCFALTSVSFYFFRPAGAIFLVAGIAFLTWQFTLTRKANAAPTKSATPNKPISIRSTRLSKRQA